MSKLSLNRLALYILVLGLVPLLFVGMDYRRQAAALTERSAAIAAVRHEALIKRQKQAQNTAVRTHYQGADPLYLQHQITPLQLLQKEQRALSQLLKNPIYTGNEQIETRHQTLKNNQLRFKEGDPSDGDNLIETLVASEHPVEVDPQDLKEILTRIEDEQTQKPQLMITDCLLKKREASYELSLQILKREYP